MLFIVILVSNNITVVSILCQHINEKKYDLQETHNANGCLTVHYLNK